MSSPGTDGPATHVLQFVDQIRDELHQITRPADRVFTARAVRANAKLFETLTAEITREAVQEMRATGMSHADVAAELGVSRARAQQLAEGQQ